MIGFAYISFSITAGAYMSEVVRSGLLAVNRGQIEAAYSIGMTTCKRCDGLCCLKLSRQAYRIYPICYRHAAWLDACLYGIGR